MRHTCDFHVFAAVVPRAVFLLASATELFRGAGQKERGSGDENATYNDQ